MEKKKNYQVTFQQKGSNSTQDLPSCSNTENGLVEWNATIIVDTKVTYCVNQLIIFLYNQSTYWTGITANVGSLLEWKSLSVQYKKIKEVYIDQYGGIQFEILSVVC